MDTNPLLNDHRHRAHGKTHAQNEQIRLDQLNGKTKYIPANNAEVFQDKYFEAAYKNYEIPDHEEGHYHIAIEARSFDPSTGAKMSSPGVQVMTKESYEMMKSIKPHGGFYGKTVHILHDPTRPKKEAPVKVAKEVNGHKFETVKQAKEYYRVTFGKEPVRSWTLERTIEEITKESSANQQ